MHLRQTVCLDISIQQRRRLTASLVLTTSEAPSNGAASGEALLSLRSGNGGADVASQPEMEADPDLEAYLRVR